METKLWHEGHLPISLQNCNAGPEDLQAALWKQTLQITDAWGVKGYKDIVPRAIFLSCYATVCHSLDVTFFETFCDVTTSKLLRHDAVSQPTITASYDFHCLAPTFKAKATQRSLETEFCALVPQGLPKPLCGSIMICTVHLSFRYK